MFTFVNFLYFNYLDLFLLLAFNCIIWYLCTLHNLRQKFILFIFLLISIGIWGFLKSFDGIIIMLLITEFLVVLLFLLLSLTFSFYSKQKFVNIVYFYLFTTSTFSIYLVFSPKTFSIFKFSHLYIYALTQDIIANDLFFFFQYFFVDFHVSIYYLAIILSLFSIFFICFYFLLKQKQQETKVKFLTFQILRKQHLLKQSIFRTQLRFFSK